MKKILYPQYYKEFSCIGGACVDSCCIGWKVLIDKKSYKSYKKIKNKDFRNKLDKNITRVRKNNDDDSYAKIKLLENGKCPFLDENCMCEIYGNLGEGAMSQTCTNYPRQYNVVDENIEVSLSMSCPVAAELCLLKESPMEFEMGEDNEDSSKRLIHLEQKTDVVSLTNELNEVFWEIRMLSISILQSRELALWERLVVLGFFCKEIQDALDNKSKKKVPLIIDKFKKRIVNGSYEGVFKDIPVDNEYQIGLIKQIVENSLKAGIGNEDFRRNLTDFIEGLNISEEFSYSEVNREIEGIKANGFNDFMKDIDYIFENYLVNLLFRNLFPLEYKKSILNSYMMLVVRYVFIKNLTLGIYGKRKADLPKEDLTNIIQTFSKSIEHSSEFLNGINNMLKSSDFENIAHIAKLLRDN